MAYIHGEPARGYGDTPLMGPSRGLGMAVAIPVGVGISIGVVLETAAIVLSAAAAAYLLIKAYEAAQARGIGVAFAASMLSAGLDRLVAGARRLIQTIRNMIERLRRAGRPQCDAAIAALVAALAEIEQTTEQLVAEAATPVPRVVELRRLMARLRQLASAISGPLQEAIAACSGAS